MKKERRGMALCVATAALALALLPGAAFAAESTTAMASNDAAQTTAISTTTQKSTTSSASTPTSAKSAATKETTTTSATADAASSKTAAAAVTSKAANGTAATQKPTTSASTATTAKKAAASMKTATATASAKKTTGASNENGWVTDDFGNVSYYVKGVKQTGWVVSSTYKDYGGQRYWLGADGNLVFSSLISKKAAGYWAYATPYGYVVRGRYVASDGNVYLANNNGKLEGTGWRVSQRYTPGELQRYYVDPTTHAAKTGFFTLDSKNYYGDPSLGYVLRGKMLYVANNATCVLLADNEGVMPSTTGWLVTGAYDNGTLQRYRIVSIEGNYLGALAGFFKVGKNSYYGTNEGYVLRGKLYYGNGYLLADNNGHLVNKCGWAVTGKYDGGELQRYYITKCCDGYLGARLGVFKVKGNYYYGTYDEGYVRRGAYFQVKKTWYYAKNSGIGVKATKNSVIAAYVLWALRTASDNSHGYDQDYRWGPNYDCSSFVITALKKTGLNVGSAYYTGNMRSTLTQLGWRWLPMGTKLKRGDILLNEVHHTALYTGTNQVVEAECNENGGITGGQSGDQTGYEIRVRSYYDFPWNGILRFKG